MAESDGEARLRNALTAGNDAHDRLFISRRDLTETLREVTRLREEVMALQAGNRLNTRVKSAQSAELERFRLAVDARWQPIDSYPFGTKLVIVNHVLCAHAERGWVRIGQYHAELGCWRYSGTNERGQFASTSGEAPTHWAAIPPPPAAPLTLEANTSGNLPQRAAG